ncbi:thiamine-phosphate pyrophosphorylase [Humitalea rosea]|uniref:Thiamine-phosphate pyrophosphorylase n=1 Tax=Humitalea rosea TaxID=990373 RepID=A0A2W7IIV3_9PROT|nr:thiamine-phosphate pyrophosphorylase [Humitalea rosea]
MPDARKAVPGLAPGRQRGVGGVLARDQAAGVLPGLARDCRAAGVALLVAGDGRAALRLRAGLHMPDRRATTGLLPFLAARRAGAPWARLTMAVHGRTSVARLQRLGADAGIVSPAFPTASHPGAPALGPHRWAGLAARVPCAMALGGISPSTAGRLPSRCAGLMAISAFVA